MEEKYESNYDKKKILIVDDEKPIVEILTYNLHKEGYETIEAITTVDILRRAGVECHTYATKNQEVTTSHHITLKADIVLIAAGFLGSQEYVTSDFGVDLTNRTNVATKHGEYESSKKNIFTAGDMHRGQSLVVWAIHEGREAAKEVDESLMGYSYL